jgi:hypothetical protein
MTVDIILSLMECGRVWSILVGGGIVEVAVDDIVN